MANYLLIFEVASLTSITSIHYNLLETQNDSSLETKSIHVQIINALNTVIINQFSKYKKQSSKTYYLFIISCILIILSLIFIIIILTTLINQSSVISVPFIVIFCFIIIAFTMVAYFCHKDLKTCVTFQYFTKKMRKLVKSVNSF